MSLMDLVFRLFWSTLRILSMERSVQDVKQDVLLGNVQLVDVMPAVKHTQMLKQ